MLLSKANRVLGGSLLVAGTCIGAGMLSLPVVTAAGGFENTLWMFLGIWLVMGFTALLMLEVSLWFPGQVNLISMSRKTLGNAGANIAWLTTVLFLYAIITAYSIGGASLFQYALDQVSPQLIHPDLTIVLFNLSMAFIVFLGAVWVDRFNRLMMVGLVLAYFALIILIAPDVHIVAPEHGTAHFLLSAVPITITSFGFHLLIPSLKSYLKGSVVELKLAIILGSALPLIVYSLWVYVIVGVIPAHGHGGLIAMSVGGGDLVPMLTQALDRIVGNTWVSLWARVFSLFALLTSFIGVSLGLFDFFADGLSIKRTNKGKCILTALSFGPPLLFALYFGRDFLKALGYASIFAVILLIIYPAAMIFMGYRAGEKVNQPYLCGAIFAICFGIGVIVLELLNLLGFLAVPNYAS